jgi:putative ABC transport system substrate-binding protein
VNGRRRFLGCAGAALAMASRLVIAQPQARVFRIGYLSARATQGSVDDAFVGAMEALGYGVGRNLVIEYRFAGNALHRLQPLAEELVRLDVDVIVTATTAGTRAAMRATRTTPIVMAATADPVGAGLVAALGRPGGNVTGLSLQTTDVARKRVQLLRELVPDATTIALLAEHVADPAQGTTRILVAETAAVAKQMGLGLVIREVATPAELADAFAHFRHERAKAMIVQASPLLIEHRATLLKIAERERLPAMYEIRNFVDDGGFVSYGPDLHDNYRRAAAYVDRIFKGALPGELPIEQPEKLVLVINLKSARDLGLSIPQSILVRANEIMQ